MFRLHCFSVLFKYLAVHNKTIFIPCHTKWLRGYIYFILHTYTYLCTVCYKCPCCFFGNYCKLNLIFFFHWGTIFFFHCAVWCPEFSWAYRYIISIVYLSETEWPPLWLLSEDFLEFRVSRLVKMHFASCSKVF